MVLRASREETILRQTTVSTLAMRPRFAFAALAAALLLTGCDLFGSSDPITGYWEGTAEFTADSVLASENVRITADYTMTFGFDFVHDSDAGLIDAGSVVARREGRLIFREAGFPADTLRFSGEVVIPPYELRGTYIDPELEVDPVDENAPYETDMWTFTVTGGSAETHDYIRNLWTFVPSDGTPFEFGINSDETFRMRHTTRPDDGGTGGVETKDAQGSRWRAVFRSLAASR